MTEIERSSKGQIIVTGSNGFIGTHLTRRLIKEGYWVKGLDLKYPAHKTLKDLDHFTTTDLRSASDTIKATKSMTHIIHLAADMGGIEYISQNNAELFRNNALMTLNLLEAAKINGIQNFMYASSACVYPKTRQLYSDSHSLKEDYAYPALPMEAYGWEKLFGELACEFYQQDFIDTIQEMNIIRFHNIYGPECTWEGGREKAPAALCRKIAYAKLTGHHNIQIFGDGEQTRSFCYINDCIEGIIRLLHTHQTKPVNLGMDQQISVKELIQAILKVADIESVTFTYMKGAPQGVRGRNSDNTRIQELLGWQPSIPIEEGIIPTYKWIEKQVNSNLDPSEKGVGYNA